MIFFGVVSRYSEILMKSTRRSPKYSSECSSGIFRKIQQLFYHWFYPRYSAEYWMIHQLFLEVFIRAGLKDSSNLLPKICRILSDRTSRFSSEKTTYILTKIHQIFFGGFCILLIDYRIPVPEKIDQLCIPFHDSKGIDTLLRIAPIPACHFDLRMTVQ